MPGRAAKGSSTGLHERNGTRTEKGLRQDLWLPDERLRFRKDDGRAGSRPATLAVDTPEAADLILLNTCHIREKAAEKVYSEIGRLRRLKEEAAESGRAVLIGVAGCVAQAEGEEIIRRAPAVDLVVGPQSYQRLPELVARAGAGGGVVETEFAVREKFAALDRPGRPRGRGATPPSSPSRKAATSSAPSASCPIPAAPRSRGPVAAIAAEARRLAAEGVREVTLLGQNVNACHGEGPDGRDWGLGRLLFRLAEIPGIDRLRYTTSHPRDMDDALIAAHRDLDALMPYLHLPVQSGSDRVLAAMNRRHTPRRLSRASSTRSAPRGRTSPSPATSSSVSPARRRPISPTPCGSSTRSATPRPSRSSTARAPARRRPAATRCRSRSRPSASPACRSAIAAVAGRLQRLAGRHDRRGPVRASRPPSRPDRRPLAVAVAGPGRRPMPALIGSIARVEITDVGSNSLFGRLVGKAGTDRPAVEATA